MSDTVVLDAQRVDEIFRDCLFQDGEDTTGYVAAEVIVNTFGFHPERLQGHREEVAALLDELPDEFKSSERGGGGGWSFLNACNDRHGNQWTGLHQNMEQLFVLGIALDLVDYVLPRMMWGALLGGMPYLVIK